MMNRRLFIGTLACGVLSAPILAKGQSTSKVYRVAMFAVSTPFSRVFVNRLQELGYTPNQNLLFELQGSEMQGEHYPGIARGIASRHPDIVVAGGSEFVLDALTAAVGSTPIVMVFIDFDPLATGRVATLSRPGGNITGLSVLQTEIAPKRLELLHDAVPTANRIAVLFDAATRGQYEVVQDAAKTLGVTLLSQELHGRLYDYEGALRIVSGARAQAVLILSSGRFFVDRVALMSAIQKYRLPSMATTAFADTGALLCYSVNFTDVWVRAAEYTDRILKGQRPSEIPVEQPTKLKFIVNLKTAKALSLIIPQSILVRADELIE